jgi:hypothetical protein
MSMSVALLGLVLVFMGLAMAGMRAGYWLFVVGIKSVLTLAVVIAALVWYVSGAHAITQSLFTEGYNDYVNMATARGILLGGFALRNIALIRCY